MIAEFNHEGPIPPAGSTVGLSEIIGLEIKVIITELERLYAARDYQTSSATSRLRAILELELELLKTSVRLYLQKRREILKKYDKDQGV